MKGDLYFYAWSADAKKLLLGIAEDKQSEAEANAKDKEEEKPKPIVIDRYRFKQDGEGYVSNETTPT